MSNQSSEQFSNSMSIGLVDGLSTKFPSQIYSAFNTIVKKRHRYIRRNKREIGDIDFLIRKEGLPVQFKEFLPNSGYVIKPSFIES